MEQVQETSDNKDKVGGAAGRDSQMQLQALSMIDMMLYSLCPTPSFQNMVIRNLLNPESGPIPTNGGN